MKVLLQLVKYSLERRALFIVTAVVMVSSIVPRVAIPRLTGNAIDEALASAHGELAFVVGQIVLAGMIRAVLGYLALYMGRGSDERRTTGCGTTSSTSSRALTSGSTTGRRPETSCPGPRWT